MNERQPKETNQHEVNKAILLIRYLIANNQQIEGNIWVSAIMSVFVRGYNLSGHSYDEFVTDLEEIKNHYKSWFEK